MQFQENREGHCLRKEKNQNIISNKKHNNFTRSKV